jgi:hypothetical protein
LFLSYGSASDALSVHECGHVRDTRDRDQRGDTIIVAGRTSDRERFLAGERRLDLDQPGQQAVHEAR